MALIDRVPGDLALYIGGYVMLSTRTLSPLMADAAMLCSLFPSHLQFSSPIGQCLNFSDPYKHVHLEEA